MRMPRGLLVAAVASILRAAVADPAEAGPCTNTARSALNACYAEATDDFWIARGNCINVSGDQDRRDCYYESRAERRDARALCKEQLAARRELCQAVGDDRYDPEFDPADFVDPREIGDTVEPNPYFPLIPGTRWVYEGGDETITVTVTEDTKLIEGVTCLVVNDLVEVEGQPIEDTDDWYAQDLDGNVWYCGEIAENFELFKGDDPEVAELVDVDGSWKTGRDSAKPGIQMLASPQVGDIYRQEVALGEAEDAAEVIDIKGTARVPAAACKTNCVVTREFTPIQPGVEANKFYAPNIGLILEEEDGERVELVEFTTP
jgi:hypothetical protein